MNADLLCSSFAKASKNEVLLVEGVERVFARKAGFVHTKVTVNRHDRLLDLEGTRTSYFFLKNETHITASVGRSWSGNVYMTDLNIPGHERWNARWLYLKDWFSRYWWLMVLFALYLLFDQIKDKYFPTKATPKSS